MVSRPAAIVDVVQAGYMIGERLLRPAMVTVARQMEERGGRRGGNHGLIKV